MTIILNDPCRGLGSNSIEIDLLDKKLSIRICYSQGLIMTHGFQYGEIEEELYGLNYIGIRTPSKFQKRLLTDIYSCRSTSYVNFIADIQRFGPIIEKYLVKDNSINNEIDMTGLRSEWYSKIVSDYFRNRKDVEMNYVSLILNSIIEERQDR